MSPVIVLKYLDTLFAPSQGENEIRGGDANTVAYAFDLSGFSYPNTVKLDYQVSTSLDFGRAMLQVGGGYASNFDYDLKFVGPSWASLWGDTRFGIEVLGAKSVRFVSSEWMEFGYKVGCEVGFSASGLASLDLTNKKIFHVENPAAQATGFAIGGGVLVNDGPYGLIEVLGRTAYGVHVTAAGHDAPVSITNSGSIEVTDGSGGTRSYGVAVDWSADVTNSGVIKAANGVVFDGAASDATSSVRLVNSGTISGLVSLTPGVDTVVNSGAIGGDVILGGGADSYDGRLGSTQGRVSGGEGDDTLSGGVGGETLDGGAGADRISGGQGDDLILDSSGSNFLRGDEGNDSVSGGTGFDDINGNAGADTAHGNDGDDWVVGGKDGDLLFGDNGFDIVYGNLGDDTVSGGDGADWVRGGQGADSVSGGAGDDLIWGDRGDDTVSGGSGADTFHSFTGAGLDRVIDFSLAEGDRIQLDPGSSYTIKQVGSDTVIDLGGGDQIVLVGVQATSLTTTSVFVG
jgi:Ca2+-binding RTX toxin-like protein